MGKLISFTIPKNFFKAYIIFRESLEIYNKITDQIQKGYNHFYVSAYAKINQSPPKLIRMDI